ncbi:MerR family transcriptional regulator [Mesorhizobium dulcispinae]|uniref:MerR family transcriptional regulator n=1 Tax=Mesorhizobium dulcispinae TaxID=3072316 RepID=UPI002A243E69|nr:MerR family transcriptional regulator [Mesorhizobium sp. VK23D]MDX8517960.1 MerR family transcriptional regulator [Mesorhizobium sp. VK23D]
MPETWRMRCFSTEEAAQISGMRRGTLDLWIFRGPETLFSAKRGSRRYFSPQDIATLAVSRELERGGVVILTAVACAFEHLQEPPAENAILIVRNGAISARTGEIISPADIPRAVHHSIQLIPIGKIVAEIRAACAKLYGGA